MGEVMGISRVFDRWAIAAFVGVVLQVALLQAADQPQWGEPFSRNMVSGETNLPATFDPETGEHVKWKTRVGTVTYSTPVIARGRVLIGTNNGSPRDPKHQGDRGVLMCFDEESGAFLWQLVVPKITTSMIWDWPRAGICSPATVEGDRVYIVSNRGEVMCLDIHGMVNGNQGPFKDERIHAAPPGEPSPRVDEKDADILWLFDMVKECGVRQHDSAHSSVLLHGDFLYVNTSNGVSDTHMEIESPNAPSLIVIDKKSGRLVARDSVNAGSRIFHSTWASPSMGRVDGKELVFLGGGDGVVYAFEAMPPGEAASPGAGKLTLAWRFDCDPTAPKENLDRFKRNRREGPSNIVGIPVFHEDRVFVAAQGDVWWGKQKAMLKCIDAGGAGDITQTGEVWSYPMDGHCMATPSVHEELVFITDCGGVIHCVDARSGKPHWTHEGRGDIWSSTLVADGKVFVTTRRGQVLVLAAAREKKVLADLKLKGQIHSSPAAANGVLYIATMKELYAVAVDR